MFAAAVVAAGSLVSISVDTARSHRIQQIRPRSFFGTSIDNIATRAKDILLSPSRVKLMLGTGLGTLTYRLGTELSIQERFDRILFVVNALRRIVLRNRLRTGIRQT